MQSISGAFDPDQSRTEDAMADEALTNKEESREALGFIARLVFIPLITGALISRAITDPVLNFSLQVRGSRNSISTSTGASRSTPPCASGAAAVL
jgi:hypothetical protein